MIQQNPNLNQTTSESDSVWCRETEAIPLGITDPLVIDDDPYFEVVLVFVQTNKGVSIQAVTPDVVDVAHVAEVVKETHERGRPRDMWSLLVVV
ncbi:hypothetical protein WAI453_011026 [Rhynchosporium graminicola]